MIGLPISIDGDEIHYTQNKEPLLSQSLSFQMLLDAVLTDHHGLAH